MSAVRIALALGLAAIALLPAPVSAHPLGNFTINHYTGIRVTPDALLIDRVTDYAEIPTFQERRQMDVDGDLAVSAAEADDYRRSTCVRQAGQLDLRSAGRRLELDLAEAGLSFPEGQAAPTTRLVCVYHASFEVALGGLSSFTFRDSSHAERRGWREVVVTGDGATIVDSDAPAESASDRLTAYPTDLLESPVEQASASWTAEPGGPGLPRFDVIDAEPVGAVSGSAGAASSTSASAPVEGVPDGVTELGGELGALFQTRELTPPLILLSVLLAAGLGALHALSPGHGKTVMAAYLVGTRGTMRHAVGLGMTVTVSHTLGVLALGVISLSAASVVPPERLYPVLGVASGAIVIAIGLYLIAVRVREVLRDRAASRAHAEAHAAHVEHGHEHEHGGDHGHDGPGSGDAHGHQHAPAVARAGSDDTQTDGWHSHGGTRHTHLPAGGTSLSWRGLFALGLAGGMVPSVSALILLLGSISLGRPAYGILLTVAFGLGMAAVLVGVGVALVYARTLLDRVPLRSSGARLARLLPATTAVIVLAAGVLITTQALLAV